VEEVGLVVQATKKSCDTKKKEDGISSCGGGAPPELTGGDGDRGSTWSKKEKMGFDL
jgi:hypothetical protein